MEPTKKLRSSGWLRNSFLSLTFFSACAFAQDSGRPVKNTLASFSTAALEVYKENSLAKVYDFYHYLNLLSQAKDASLEAELKETIFALFEDRNILIEDFTTEKKDRIPLSYFLENIRSKELTFSVKNERITKNTYSNHWLDSYTLEITEKSQTRVLNLQQTIVMKPETKNFGNSSREVWQTFLGSIE